MLEAIASMLPDDWEISVYGDSFICPCGHEIEQDGICPNGHESPLLAMGLI
jgi:hypothetical protein